MKLPIKAALGFVATFATAMVPLIHSSSRAYQDGPAIESAVLMGTNGLTQAAYDDAKSTLDIYRELTQREAHEMKDRMADWEDENSFRHRLNNIRADVTARRAQILVDAEKDPAIRKMTADRDLELKAYKKALEYDTKVNRQKKIIRQAEQKWAAEQDLFSRADASASDTALALKHDAERKYNDAVAKANEVIADLDKKLAESKERWDAKIEALKLERQTAAQRQIAEAEKLADEKTNELLREHAKAEEDIFRQLKRVRTPEEVSACQNHASAKRKIAEIEKFWKDAARNTAESIGLSQKIAWWLRSKRVSPYAVLLIGLLPLAAYGIIGVGYGAKLFEVVAYMMKAVI